MVGAPGRVGTWRPARQATPHLVYTFVYDSEFLMSTRLDSDDDDDPHLPLNPHLITTERDGEGDGAREPRGGVESGTGTNDEDEVIVARRCTRK